jgi:CelD/BcsL family acetyltransferase involved in cellulose biosynthesis
VESVEWIVDVARFAAIAERWDRLAEEDPSPFLLSAWLLAWWGSLAGREGLQIAVLWRDGAVGAGLPLRGGRRRWEAAVDHGYPPFCGRLAADDDACRRLAAEVMARAPAEVMLRSVPAGDPAMESLVAAAAEAGRWTLVEPMPPSLVTETTGAFEAYRARLSPKVRSEVGRLRRKAEREHRLEVAPVAVPDDLKAQIDRALALEAAGWKGRAGTAILCRPEIEAFFRRLTRDLHGTGKLRISELGVDGESAAMALSVLHRERLFTLRVAYDERHRQLGLGFVLLMAMIERCFELGLRAYEFCGTEEEYERRYATGERARRRLRLYQPSLVTGPRYLYRRDLRPILRHDSHPATPSPS